MLPETRARRYFAQLLSGVKHIHANGFCHRDIKPENCMIDAATDTLKVIDFGMTKHLECACPRYGYRSLLARADASALFITLLAAAKTLMIGTPDYMAPELLTHNLADAMHGPSPEGEYDPRAVDVWSMGALLFICVTGVFPFEDPRRPNDMCATLENVRKARYRPLPPTVSPELNGALGALCMACWHR
jgi:serine/threonine protein kinase